MAEPRATFLAMYDTIAPRKVINVLAQHGSPDVLQLGATALIQDPAKVFSALVDVIFSLRNALPRLNNPCPNRTTRFTNPHTTIVMRFVRFTI